MKERILGSVVAILTVVILGAIAAITVKDAITVKPVEEKADLTKVWSCGFYDSAYQDRPSAAMALQVLKNCDKNDPTRKTLENSYIKLDDIKVIVP